MGDFSKYNTKKFYHSKLFRQQIEQDQLAKAEYIDKKNELIERYTSQKEYAEMVRTKIRPNMTVKEDDRDKDTNGPAPSASFAEALS